MATLVANRCPGYSGRLIPLTVNQAIPAILDVTLEYEGVAGNQLASIGVMTQLQVDQSVAAQFQNALTDVIYVTPFGDRAGKITMSFITNRECNTFISDVKTLDHYLNYRLLPGASESTAVPATVSVGSASFRAYLIAMSLQGQSQQQLVQGTLVFAGWPS